MIRRPLTCWLSAFAALMLIASPGVSAASDESPGRRTFGDRIGLDLALGFGYGYSMRARTNGQDVADVRLLLVQPRARVELADWSRDDHWWAGRLDLVIEPELAINFEPQTGVGGGITGGFRYLILEDRQWSPYAIGTAGFGGIDYGLTSQDDGFEFFLQFGFGVRRALAHGRALIGEVRMYHISNAALHPPNDGIDAIAFLLGMQFR